MILHEFVHAFPVVIRSTVIRIVSRNPYFISFLTVQVSELGIFKIQPICFLCTVLFAKTGTVSISCISSIHEVSFPHSFQILAVSVLLNFIISCSRFSFMKTPAFTLLYSRGRGRIDNGFDIFSLSNHYSHIGYISIYVDSIMQNINGTL